MEYTMSQRTELIAKECLSSKEKDPIKLFCLIASKDFVRIHGPEHHFLDGACILTAFKNCGGDICLDEGLAWMSEQSIKMPGAICGYWGVCGAVTSVGAALSFIDKTGPLSRDDWGKHMELTSHTLMKLSSTGGPRCCKRDAFFAIQSVTEYINANYDVTIPQSNIKCIFGSENPQCLGNNCPFCR